MSDNNPSATSLVGFIRHITTLEADRNQGSTDEIVLYRGHSKASYTLTPSALRHNEIIEQEHVILRELVASHPSEFVNDRSTLEQLARAQHYSAPTRLLDVTWNPLVALYFAANNNIRERGQVIRFRIKSNLVKYYDSDTVSCLANLSHLKSEERREIEKSLQTLSKSIVKFNQVPSVDRLLQFIRAEKAYFRSEIHPDDLRSTLVVKPKQNSKRIIAQSGAFILFGLLQDLDNTPPPGISIDRIDITHSKPDIIDELDAMSINERTLFPEIERSARYIAERYSPHKFDEKTEEHLQQLLDKIRTNKNNPKASMSEVYEALRRMVEWSTAAF